MTARPAPASRPDPHLRRAGTYTVTLTVTDNDGATATVTQRTVTVRPNVPPTAAFTARLPTSTGLASMRAPSTDTDGTIAVRLGLR